MLGLRFWCRRSKRKSKSRSEFDMSICAPCPPLQKIRPPTSQVTYNVVVVSCAFCRFLLAWPASFRAEVFPPVSVHYSTNPCIVVATTTAAAIDTLIGCCTPPCHIASYHMPTTVATNNSMTIFRIAPGPRLSRTALTGPYHPTDSWRILYRHFPNHHEGRDSGSGSPFQSSTGESTTDGRTDGRTEV